MRGTLSSESSDETHSSCAKWIGLVLALLAVVLVANTLRKGKDDASRSSGSVRRGARMTDVYALFDTTIRQFFPDVLGTAVKFYAQIMRQQ